MQSHPDNPQIMTTTLLDHYLAQKGERRSDVIAYLAALDHLSQVAPSIAESICQELRDQRAKLKLIASENYSSLSVQLAMGNLLTDKYCEGSPYHRFYAGCENVDRIEAEAVALAKELFSVEHAYVQPHSGADANLVAFWSILTQKIQHPFLDKLSYKTVDQLSPEAFETLRQLLCNQAFMGLSLDAGGHLTHGMRHNVSAKMMRAYSYSVDPQTGRLDYEAIAQQARAVRPLILLGGYSAYPRLIDFAKLREIADEVGAVLMVDMAHFAGLVAGKVFTGVFDPTRYAQVITTTTHKTLRGPRGGMILSTKAYAPTLDKGCPLLLGGPLPHVIAAKAVAFREALSPDFSRYAKKIVENAQTLAEALSAKGFQLVTGGTDNHLLLLDLSQRGMTGRVAEHALYHAGITANRNMIPHDPQGAWYTSGLRLGTPALTSLGMGREEMKEVAAIIAEVLSHTEPEVVPATGAASKSVGVTAPRVLREARERVEALLSQYPLYPELLPVTKEVQSGTSRERRRT